MSERRGKLSSEVSPAEKYPQIIDKVRPYMVQVAVEQLRKYFASGDTISADTASAVSPDHEKALLEEHRERGQRAWAFAEDFTIRVLKQSIHDWLYKNTTSGYFTGGKIALSLQDKTEIAAYLVSPQIIQGVIDEAYEEARVRHKFENL